MFLALIFESAKADIAFLATIVGLFGAIVGMFLNIRKEQRDLRKGRKDDLVSAIRAEMGKTPDRVLVGPQPFIVEMKKEFITRDDHRRDLDGFGARVTKLEDFREKDKKELSDKIDGIPGKVVAMLKDTKGLLG